MKRILILLSIILLSVAGISQKNAPKYEVGQLVFYENWGRIDSMTIFHVQYISREYVYFGDFEVVKMKYKPPYLMAIGRYEHELFFTRWELTIAISKKLISPKQIKNYKYVGIGKQSLKGIAAIHSGISYPFGNTGFLLREMAITN
jgi:hypothetical protein